MSQNISDGNYTIEVKLSGGSGKANIVSPTKLTVDDGQMQAEIEWSSSSYDYMEVNGKDYYPVNDDGNSVFVIEVSELDRDIPITAETVAMSEPHMIEYTLHFDSSTMKNTNSSISGFIFGGIGAMVILAAAMTAVIRKKKSYGKK